MKKYMLMVLVFSLVFTGCTKKDNEKSSLLDDNKNENAPALVQKEKEQDSEVSNKESNTNLTSNKKDGNEKQPPDLSEVLSAAFKKTQSIDKELSFMEKETITLDKKDNHTEPRVLTQYTKDNQIYKITATEPDDSGKMTGLTSYYYEDGSLLLIKQPFAQYGFWEGRLIVWADENLKILDKPENERLKRQESLVNTLNKYLDVFDEDKEK